MYSGIASTDKSIIKERRLENKIAKILRNKKTKKRGDTMKKKDFKKRLDQIDEILTGIDGLSNEGRLEINTTISTILNLHLRTSDSEVVDKKAG